MLTEPEDGESWGPQDIMKMSLEDYKKYREHIFNEIGLLTPDEARECMEIKKPPPPYHFESF
jgi:hypothetical protein